MMRTLLFALAVVSQIVRVDAVPGNLNCDGTQWIANNPFPDPGGDMGNIPVYNEVNQASDCQIVNLPTSVEFCAEYTITVRSSLPMGHKISTSAGYLDGHPVALTDGQNDRCRHQYSQTETKYVYRANTVPGDGQHRFYALCGKFNGPMYAITASRPHTNPQSRSSCASVACFAPLNSTDQACFPATASPTPEPPGTAVNNNGRSRSNASIPTVSVATLVAALIGTVAAFM